MTYSMDFPILRGYPLGLTYKYSINTLNNEPGGNHVSYVYTSGTYALPRDKFGAPLVENAVPNLRTLASTPGHVSVTWLGRPGVFLQTRTNLSSGSWVDQLETDGMSSTNWPTGGSSLFFRLIKP